MFFGGGGGEKIRKQSVGGRGKSPYSEDCVGALGAPTWGTAHPTPQHYNNDGFPYDLVININGREYNIQARPIINRPNNGLFQPRVHTEMDDPRNCPKPGLKQPASSAVLRE